MCERTKSFPDAMVRPSEDDAFSRPEVDNALARPEVDDALVITPEFPDAMATPEEADKIGKWVDRIFESKYEELEKLEGQMRRRSPKTSIPMTF